MAKKCLRIKQRLTPKYPVSKYNRCSLCGRPRGFIRKFGICRICFRNLALEGKLPGIRKASW
jgi:small subunit ribosomal protein S14